MAKGIVLHVDDEREWLNDVKDLVTYDHDLRDQIEVLGATSEADALKIIESEGPKLMAVLSDNRLNGITEDGSGERVALAAKEAGIKRVAILTASPGDVALETRKKGIEALGKSGLNVIRAYLDVVVRDLQGAQR